MPAVAPPQIAKVSSSVGGKPPPVTLRIASLLPGLTDIIHDLQLSQSIVATSHECTAPGGTLAITRPKLSTAALSAVEITSGWNALSLHPLYEQLPTRICSFYSVDLDKLCHASPNVLLTHLTPPGEFGCSEEEIQSTLQSLVGDIRVISADPKCLHEVYQLYHEVARVVGTNAAPFIAKTRARLMRLSRLPVVRRPKITIVQWTEPLYLAGDWVPEIIKLCAEPDGVTAVGSPSVLVEPSILYNADIVIFAICALRLPACAALMKKFWHDHKKIFSRWSGRFVLTDATSLFSRTALSSIVTSAEVVAEIVSNDARFGHKGVLWADWQPT